jgi:rRNA-processing protein FCF1
VVLDTNVLFLVVRVGFPLEEEVGRALPGAQLLIPACVVAELDGLTKSLTPGAMTARALSERYPVVPTTLRGDDGVIEAAISSRAWVATSDRELRRLLAIRGITALVPRDRHRLEVVPGRRAVPPRGPRSTRDSALGGNG